MGDFCVRVGGSRNRNQYIVFKSVVLWYYTRLFVVSCSVVSEKGEQIRPRCELYEHGLFFNRCALRAVFGMRVSSARALRRANRFQVDAYVSRLLPQRDMATFRGSCGTMAPSDSAAFVASTVGSFCEGKISV